MSRAVALACVALGVLAPAAGARTYDVPLGLGPALAKTVRATPLDVFVPSLIALDYDGRVYGSGGGTKREWSLSLSATRRCGANACFLAEFIATLGAQPHNPVAVRLRGGVKGRYRGLSCGASCSPPAIEWRRRGVLYSIQAKVAEPGISPKQLLVQAANSALAAGPR